MSQILRVKLVTHVLDRLRQLVKNLHIRNRLITRRETKFKHQNTLQINQIFMIIQDRRPLQL